MLRILLILSIDSTYLDSKKSNIGAIFIGITFFFKVLADD
jgi:hypothetical protein